MMRKRPPLIAELARLVADYPEKDWRALGDSLQNGEFLKQLTVAVEAMADLAASAGQAQKMRRKTTSHKSRFAELAKKEPEKAQVLTALKDRLTDKSTRPSLAQLRGLAEALGMKDELPGRREQAIDQILRHLSGWTIQEIEVALNMTPPEQRDLGYEYGRWVDLILRDRTRSG